MKMANGLKIIAVDGVSPNPETIRNEEYPHRNAYYSVIPEDADVTETVLRLDKISTMFNVEIVISLTEDITQISDELKDKVLVAL